MLLLAPLQVVPNAHDTPLQCLEYAAERGELATCGMGNKVKVWDASRPSALRHVLTLDHAEKDDAEHGDDSAAARKTNMQWLTRSDMAGLPNASGIVLETIQNANRDVPEVTQVRARARARAAGGRRRRPAGSGQWAVEACNAPIHAYGMVWHCVKEIIAPCVLPYGRLGLTASSLTAVLTACRPDCCPDCFLAAVLTAAAVM